MDPILNFINNRPVISNMKYEDGQIGMIIDTISSLSVDSMQKLIGHNKIKILPPTRHLISLTSHLGNCTEGNTLH
jgi:hypothetical protein